VCGAPTLAPTGARKAIVRSRLALVKLLAAIACSGCSLALDFDSTSKEPVKPQPTFCGEHSTPPAIFCDDFDAAPLDMKWPNLDVMNGEATNDTGAATSAPNSLLSVADPVGVTGKVRAVSTVGFLELSSTKVGLRISFNMRVDQFDSAIGAKTNVFDFLYGSITDFNQVLVVLQSTGSEVLVMLAENPQKVGDSNNLYQQYGPFPIRPLPGQWTKVAVDIDILNPTGAGNSVRFALDDQMLLDTTLLYPFKGQTPRLELGVGWVDSEMMPSQTWAIRYDDFLVEAVAR
jgi:hypothetical protein